MQINTLSVIGLTESHLGEIQTPFQSFKINQHIKDDLMALINAANDVGFNLTIASGFRDFHRQKDIWERKFNGKTTILDAQSQPLNWADLTEKERLFSILRWSALPGASRHHWGTDLDVYASNLLPDDSQLQLEPWEYLDGHQTPFYDWLRVNLSTFGFFFPYRKDLGGVAPEPWHISHIKCSAQYLTHLSDALVLDTLTKENVCGLPIITANFDNIYSRYITNICKDHCYG